MTPLNREQFIATTRPRIEVVEVPGVGAVSLRKLSTRRQKEWSAATMAMGEGNGERSVALLIALSLVDADGNPIYDPADEAAVASVLDMDHDATSALFEAIKGFNGMTPAALEDATKN